MVSTIRGISAVAVAFVSNLIVVKLFWSFVLMLTPFESFSSVLRLKEMLVYLHIPPVMENVTMALSLLTLIVPCFVYRTGLAQRVTLWIMGAHSAQGEEKSWIENAFSQVCEKNHTSVRDYKFYVTDEAVENAWALGKNHITVTRALLRNLPKELLTGILAHEAGHLAHGDTKMLTLIACMQNMGQLAINILCAVTSICSWVAKIPFVGIAATILSWFIALSVMPLQILVNLPSNIFILFLSRQDEYAADRYACELGLGRELYDGLARICAGEQRMSFTQRIWATHPDTENRLKRILAYIQRERNGKPEE